MSLKKFLGIVFSTILVYRVVTYIIIFFWGKSLWWHGVYTDNWNHYQLGFILVALGFLLPLFKKKLVNKYWPIAIGTGMIIDEITDVIKLFHLYPLPQNFRDSLGDLALITITFILFSLSLIIGSLLIKNS